jgi:hypothetical protein
VGTYYTYHVHGQQQQHSVQQHQQQYQQLPGGPWSGPGQQQMRQGVPVASASAVGQLGSWHSGSIQQQQQQRGSIYGQPAAAAAGATGQLAGGSRASHDGGGSSAAAAAARADAAATAAAAAKIQQELGQVRPGRSSSLQIHHQLRPVQPLAAMLRLLTVASLHYAPSSQPGSARAVRIYAYICWVCHLTTRTPHSCELPFSCRLCSCPRL